MSQRRPDVDVAVLGAGPAGAAAALTAARAGLHVALFDPQRGSIDKPCGEGIMPAGVAALERLGLASVCARGRRFGSVRLVFEGLDPIDVALPGHGLALERPVLSGALDEALGRSRRIVRHLERADVRRDGDAWRVESRSTSVQARCVVVADGNGGFTAPWMGRARVGGTKRFGLRARYLARGSSSGACASGVEVYLGRRSEVYLTPLAGGLVNVVILAEADRDAVSGAESDFARLMTRHPAAAARLSDLVTPPESRLLARVRPRRLGLDGLFLAGDAGGGVDPILGCGVAIALESGVLAGEACVRLAHGDLASAVESSYEREYRTSTRRRRALASFLGTLARHPKLARSASVVAGSSSVVSRVLASIAAGDTSRWATVAS